MPPFDPVTEEAKVRSRQSGPKDQYSDNDPRVGASSTGFIIASDNWSDDFDARVLVSSDGLSWSNLEVRKSGFIMQEASALRALC